MTKNSDGIVHLVLVVFIAIFGLVILVYFALRNGNVSFKPQGELKQNTESGLPSSTPTSNPTLETLGPNESENDYWLIHQYNIKNSEKGYTKVSLPKNHNLDLTVEIFSSPAKHFCNLGSYDFCRMQITSNAIADCFFQSANGGIGRGGGDGKYIFQKEKLGSISYSMYAWQWDSTIDSYNPDNPDFRISFHSIGTDKESFNSCVDFIKSTLRKVEVTQVTQEYIDQYYSKYFN